MRAVGMMCHTIPMHTHTIANRDYTPVPSEYQGMSIQQVIDLIDEDAREAELESIARNQIPHRWQ